MLPFARTGWRLGWLACVATAMTATALAARQGSVAAPADDREVAAIKAAMNQPSRLVAPDTFGLTWSRYDVLKSRSRLQYIPFTVAIDPRRVSTPDVTVYWRVTSPVAGAPGGRVIAEGSRSATSRVPGPQVYISHAFEAPSGTYQVTVVIKESSGGRSPADSGRMASLTQDVLVPDFWSGEFTTSPIIAAEALIPLTTPQSSAQRAERPYALQSWEIVPVFGGHFSRRSEFWTLIQIYNARVDARNKPDIRVEYRYFLRQGTGEKFFNQTAPQTFSAATLPPEFDLAAGNQLESTQGLPLVAFPPGQYRLEVRITDALSSETLTRELAFTVAEQ